MSYYFVVVADGSRARFFELQSTDMPELESGPTLVEQTSISNPETGKSEGEVFADTRSGSNRVSSAANPHAYDDHRERHMEEFERRFAREVGKEAVSRAGKLDTRCLVLVADPRMLHYLQGEVSSFKNGKRDLVEYARDLTKLAPDEIHRHLAKDGLIPEKKRPRGGPSNVPPGRW
ncbi:host attachment protein [Kiritimatiella glycovorans]|uniref:Protein required for attachment to host cells n=1 Tax=Kiritimatiella glycovorans TaxID=1307763 RepID=A0A0G3EH38_9BACT|nr:host attachment protein [Kiritimatiella glycovorans]AKJ64125.1 hypothetical protein L21SP4_00862 [Kiritimatiella glycovorans]